MDFYKQKLRLSGITSIIKLIKISIIIKQIQFNIAESKWIKKKFITGFFLSGVIYSTWKRITKRNGGHISVI